jgi:hypothetical protein
MEAPRGFARCAGLLVFQMWRHCHNL